jgi:hypothetical protein
MQMKKTGIYLKAAFWLWVVTVITAAMLPSTTQAKYAASATAEAGARVAKWDVADRFTEEVLEAKGIELGGPGVVTNLNDVDPADELPNRAATLLVTVGTAYPTTITLHNRSEVAAKYTLIPEVEGGSLPGIAVTDVTDDQSRTYASGTDYDTGSIVIDGEPVDTIWVVVPCETKAEVALTLTPTGSFTGLTIDSITTQVD